MQTLTFHQQNENSFSNKVHSFIQSGPEKRGDWKLSKIDKEEKQIELSCQSGNNTDNKYNRKILDEYIRPWMEQNGFRLIQKQHHYKESEHTKKRVQRGVNFFK